MCYARAYAWSCAGPALYENTAEKLARELAQIELCPPLYISQVTDPLQPVAEIRELTAQVVAVAMRYGVPFHLLTKNGEGVLWLLKRLPQLRSYPRWWLAMTIEAPPAKQRVTSPGASPIEERLRAVEACAQAGVFVVVRTDPAIWGLVREEDEIWILDHARDSGARHLISALGHFNRLSFARLRAALRAAGLREEEAEVRRFYGPGGEEGFFRAGTIRAPLPLRAQFHQFMRDEAEKRGMTYAACLEMGREWDSPGLPHCEAAPQGNLARKVAPGRFEPIPGCYADCLRGCPDPSGPPCGRPALLERYPYPFSLLLPRPSPLFA
jgi:DNA repair photolyase